MLKIYFFRLRGIFVFFVIFVCFLRTYLYINSVVKIKEGINSFNVMVSNIGNISNMVIFIFAFI